MANIAAVFHWEPAAMGRMSLGELMKWHELAAERGPRAKE